jgi:hypothetical protein
MLIVGTNRNFKVNKPEADFTILIVGGLSLRLGLLWRKLDKSPINRMGLIVGGFLFIFIGVLDFTFG